MSVLKVFVVNCGSSSIKYKVFSYHEATNTLDVLAFGMIEKIGEEISIFDYESKSGKVNFQKPISDHAEALSEVLQMLTNKEKGVVKNLDEIMIVGHRVVHGGEEFSFPVIIDEETEKIIEKYSIMAPLHNPANLKGIRILRKLIPNALHVAVFDTAFHQTIPDYAYIYAIPYEYYEKYKIRRYGFHGSSHKYVSRRAAEIISRRLEELKIITCHLGAGSSIAAIKNGKCVETSMGLTPLEGLVMATRSGDIDPSIFYFLVKWENKDIDEVYNILNEKSGLLGLSGVSKDLRAIKESADKGNRRAQLAINVFVHRVRKYIGAYAAVMGGVDVIVFTAGIGERAPWMRELILDGLEFLGIKIDKTKNLDPDKFSGIISSDDSKVKVLVISTDEEGVIAEEAISTALSVRK
ncbi:MAG: acetate kinase [Nitrososphaerota archaeon]